MARSALWFCLLVPALFPASAEAATHLVRPDGTGDYPSIDAAIQAEEVVDGDVIELADGVFTGPNNRDVYFRGKAITVRSQSDDPKACIIDCQEYARAFVFAYGEGPSSVLEAVTITRGYGSSGGGIYITSSSPTVRRCIFTDNHAGDGGAIRT